MGNYNDFDLELDVKVGSKRSKNLKAHTDPAACSTIPLSKTCGGGGSAYCHTAKNCSNGCR